MLLRLLSLSCPAANVSPSCGVVWRLLPAKDLEAWVVGDGGADDEVTDLLLWR
jgi:hypothetical protein